MDDKIKAGKAVSKSKMLIVFEEAEGIDFDKFQCVNNLNTSTGGYSSFYQLYSPTSVSTPNLEVIDFVIQDMVLGKTLRYICADQEDTDYLLEFIKTTNDLNQKYSIEDILSKMYVSAKVCVETLVGFDWDVQRTKTCLADCGYKYRS